MGAASIQAESGGRQPINEGTAKAREAYTRLPSDRYVLGIDVGTGGTRGVIVVSRGRPAHMARSRSYDSSIDIQREPAPLLSTADFTNAIPRTPASIEGTMSLRGWLVRTDAAKSR